MAGVIKLAAFNSLVEVFWEDITSHVNVELREVKPAPCRSFGVIVKKSDKFVVIATSIFEREKGEKEIEGDFLAIPTGTIRECRQIKP